MLLYRCQAWCGCANACVQGTERQRDHVARIVVDGFLRPALPEAVCLAGVCWARPAPRRWPTPDARQC
eukprot:6057109-Lingulodinium_polyedra.AAC.1